MTTNLSEHAYALLVLARAQTRQLISGTCARETASASRASGRGGQVQRLRGGRRRGGCHCNDGDDDGEVAGSRAVVLSQVRPARSGQAVVDAMKADGIPRHVGYKCGSVTMKRGDGWLVGWMDDERAREGAGERATDGREALFLLLLVLWCWNIQITSPAPWAHVSCASRVKATCCNVGYAARCVALPAYGLFDWGLSLFSTTYLTGERRRLHWGHLAGVAAVSMVGVIATCGAFWGRQVDGRGGATRRPVLAAGRGRRRRWRRRGRALSLSHALRTANPASLRAVRWAARVASILGTWAPAPAPAPAGATTIAISRAAAAAAAAPSTIAISVSVSISITVSAISISVAIAVSIAVSIVSVSITEVSSISSVAVASSAAKPAAWTWAAASMTQIREEPAFEGGGRSFEMHKVAEAAARTLAHIELATARLAKVGNRRELAHQQAACSGIDHESATAWYYVHVYQEMRGQGVRNGADTRLWRKGVAARLLVLVLVRSLGSKQPVCVSASASASGSVRARKVVRAQLERVLVAISVSVSLCAPWLPLALGVAVVVCVKACVWLCRVCCCFLLRSDSSEERGERGRVQDDNVPA